SQFQQGTSKPGSYYFAHCLSHAGGTGCRDQGHTLIPRQQRASFTFPKKQTGHSFGELISSKNTRRNFLTGNSRKRSFFRRLPYTNISAYPGDHGIPGPDRYREIKSGNNSYRSQWVPLFIHTVLGTFGMHAQPI